MVRENAFNRPRLERGNGRNARMAIVFEYDTFSEEGVALPFSRFEFSSALRWRRGRNFGN